jgi:hypothetical protein
MLIQIALRTRITPTLVADRSTMPIWGGVMIMVTTALLLLGCISQESVCEILKTRFGTELKNFRFTAVFLSNWPQLPIRSFDFQSVSERL